jgi:hypothetical protein
MASHAFSADEFAKLVQEIVRSRCKRARVTKLGASRYLWEDGEHNGLAEIFVRPTVNDVLVRFIPPSKGSTRTRTCESFAYNIDSSNLVAQAIIAWIYDRNRDGFEKLIGLKH